MKSGLQLGNGPVFSLGFGAYNTQTTAFGFSTTTKTGAFSNNGNNMNVSGKSGSVSDIYSGMLTVNFLAENGSTYVEAFLGDTALVNKTEINYEKSVLYLNGLTLGGWAQHIRQRLFHDPSVPFPSARFRNRRYPLWRSWDWEAFWQGAADINV